MKKKWIIGIIVVIILIAIVGGGSDDESQKEITSVENNTAEEFAEDALSDSEKEIAEVDGVAQAEAATVEETVLIDQDDVVITAKGLEDDSIWGTGLKLLIENNSTKDLGVGCKALIVNNYMLTDLFSSQVAAGKKGNETMYLSSTELKAAGIENIGQIEVYFYIYDSETYETIREFDKVTVQTSLFDSMDVKAMDDGQELLNQDGIRIVGKYVDEDSFWGAAILLYVENNSGKNVTVSCDDMSVNGFMMTPLFSSTVYNEKMSLDEITLMSSELEENGITSIEDVELKFRVFNPDTYDTMFETDPISFSMQ